MSTSAIRHARGGFYSRSGKRALDVTVAALVLFVTLPVLAVIAAAVVLTMGWPVLFRDLRAGVDGVPFVLLKFRTMTNARDESGQLLPDARRLTRLGRFLRQSSLDELPELLQVLTGSMSLVGPRPLPVRYVPRYTAEQRRRLEVRPGVTGLAQTRGRNTLSWEERFALDVKYVDQYNARLDFAVLFATVAVVLHRGGVSHPGHATMYEFSRAVTMSKRGSGTASIHRGIA